MTKNNFWIWILVAAVAGVFFFWGRSRGRDDGKVTLINNVALVKEIAELSALDVSGISTVKVTNKAAETGMFGQLKNMLNENTLNISVPYEAKYGVDLKNRDVAINTDEKTVTVYLPDVKLLSMQLKLDSVDAIYKTGLLQTATVEQYVKVQSKLYSETQKSLLASDQYFGLARSHIQAIMEHYYAPLGYKVTCKFGEAEKVNIPKL